MKHLSIQHTVMPPEWQPKPTFNGWDATHDYTIIDKVAAKWERIKGEATARKLQQVQKKTLIERWLGL